MPSLKEQLRARLEGQNPLRSQLADRLERMENGGGTAVLETPEEAVVNAKKELDTAVKEGLSIWDVTANKDIFDP
jgi:hypothetical protein